MEKEEKYQGISDELLKVLKDYREEPRHNHNDPFRMASDYGISVYTACLEKELGAYQVCFFKVEGGRWRKHLYIQSGISLEQARFLVAHGIARFFQKRNDKIPLGKGEEDKIIVHSRVESHDKSYAGEFGMAKTDLNEEEKKKLEANFFAQELMLPSETFLQEASRFTHKLNQLKAAASYFGVHEGLIIKTLNDLADKKNDPTIKSMLTNYFPRENTTGEESEVKSKKNVRKANSKKNKRDGSLE